MNLRGLIAVLACTSYIGAVKAKVKGVVLFCFLMAGTACSPSESPSSGRSTSAGTSEGSALVWSSSFAELKIEAGSPLEYTAVAASANAEAEAVYSLDFIASTCDDGSWSPGIGINSETGVLSGTPSGSDVGRCAVTLRAVAGSASIFGELDIVVSAASSNSSGSVSPSPSPSVPPNTAPTIVLTAPLNDDDVIEKNSSISITWTDDDTEDDATISLYYKSSPSGQCSDGTLIVTGLSEDDATDSYSWTPSSLATDVYYVCAVIDDGSNSPVQDFADQLIVYDDSEDFCVWTGLVDTDWATSGNWLDCSGSAPAGVSDVIILRERANQPLLAASTTIDSFASGVGGGTVSIAAGATLTISNVTSTVSSSVQLQGDTAGCTTCEVLTGGDLYIVNGASLTLGSGLVLFLPHNMTTYVGNGSTSGHLKTVTASATESEWPLIRAENSWERHKGIDVAGASGDLSSVEIDGLTLDWVSKSHNHFGFVDFFNIVQLDNIRMAYYDQGNVSFGVTNPYIFLSDCTNSSISDTSWSGLNFAQPIRMNNYTNNIDASGCSGVGPVTIAGSGENHGYGEIHELDPNGILTWSHTSTFTCTWNGSANSSWDDSDNWTGCANSRGGYPTQLDWVVIPSGMPNEPTIASGEFSIRGFAAGTGGGVLTVASGARLILLEADSVASSVTLQGETGSCGLSRIFPVNHVNVINNSTLTLGKCIELRFPNWGVTVNVGDGTTAGHLATVTADADSTKWPQLRGLDNYTYWDGFKALGVDGANKSSISIDGLHILQARPGVSVRFLYFKDYYTVDKMDNITIGISSTYLPTYTAALIGIENCANATFNDLNWDEIDFIHDPTTGGGSNVNISGCSSLGVDALQFSPFTGGTNAGYGAGMAVDADDVLAW